MAVDKGWLLSMLEEWNSSAAKDKLRIRLIAVGGTALTLLNIKASTKDIDFTVPEDDVAALMALLERIGAKHAGGISYRTKEGARLDVFKGGQIFSTALPEDFLERSAMVKDFGRIRLHALSLHDIIITKLARGSVDDEEDIRAVFKVHEIDVAMLKTRNREVQKLNHDKILEYHFERLLNVLLKEWRLES